MRMRVWLVLLAALPLLTVGSGATAGTSVPPRNGLIAAFGGDGIYLVDAQRMKSWKVPGTAELGEPAWSPDGSLLAVASWDDSADSVYTMRPDGSDRRLVLRDAWSPSWSPDGQRLVVVQGGCFRSSTCDSGFESVSVLVTVRADGSDVHQLTFDHGNENDGADYPAWSPDGKWIAFMGGEGAVRLVSANGKDFRTIADNGWNVAWSPDGSKLAFQTIDNAKDYREEIVVFDLATERRTTIPSRKSSISSLAWSPDGKQFAFLSNRPMPKSAVGGCGGEMPLDLWVMNADGSNPHRISKGSYSRPSWGTFQPAPTPSSQPEPKPSLQAEPKPSLQAEPKPSLQSEPKPNPSAGSVPIAGTPSTSTTASDVTKSARTVPRVVATRTTLRALGKGLIAARGRDAIYLIDPRRGEVRRIPGTAKMAQPAWSPNGSVLAVEHADAHGTSVYTIRPDGGHPQLVLRNASSPSWSADGKRLFFLRNVCLAQNGCSAVDDDAVLMTVRLDGGDAHAVDAENEDAYTDPAEPAFPSDGNWIGFYADEGPSPVFDSSAAAWSPDAKHLAFVSGLPTADEGASGKDPNPALWVVAAEGGRPRLLATGIYGRPSWAASRPDPRPSD
jgi:Tol biopolymer transport system component